MKRGLILVCVLFWNATTLECFAEHGSEDIPEMLDSTYLDAVTISLAKSDSILSPTTLVHTIDKSDIDFQSDQTSADVLRSSGKVFIQKSQQGGGSPLIRGFGANRILYIVDGVRYNNLIFRGGNIQNILNIDPFSLESIDVLNGPGSSQFGSDALGAVLHFKTKKPQFTDSKKLETKGESQLRFSSANKEKTVHFEFHVGNNKWSNFLSVSRWSFDDLTQGRKGPEEYLDRDYVVRYNQNDYLLNNPNPRTQHDTKYSQINLLNKSAIALSNKTHIEFNIHYSETSPYSRYERSLVLDADNNPKYGEWYYGPQVWSMGQIALVSTSKKKLYDSFKLSIAGQRFEESRISRLYNSTTQLNQEEQVNSLNANLNFTKRIKARHQLHYGLESFYNDLSSVGYDLNINDSSITTALSRYPQAKLFNASGFISYFFQVNPKLSLTSGARYSHFDMKADLSGNTELMELPFDEAVNINDTWSADIGVAYSLGNLQISSSVRTGFRAPNADDIGKVFDSEPGVLVVPNADLQAEQVITPDFTMQWKQKDVFEFTVNCFYSYVNKALVRANYQLNGEDSLVYFNALSQIQAVQNAAHEEIYGFNNTIKIRMSNHLSVSHSVNYQKGKVELTGGQTYASRHVTPLFGQVQMTYQKEKFKTLVLYEYQGGFDSNELAISEQNKRHIYLIDANGNPYVKGWNIVSVGQEYLVSKNISINFSIRNIFDQRYRTYSSAIANSGRDLRVRIKTVF